MIHMRSTGQTLPLTTLDLKIQDEPNIIMMIGFSGSYHEKRYNLLIGVYHLLLQEHLRLASSQVMRPS
jgi:hypothetical protein